MLRCMIFFSFKVDAMGLESSENKSKTQKVNIVCLSKIYKADNFLFISEIDYDSMTAKVDLPNCICKYNITDLQHASWSSEQLDLLLLRHLLFWENLVIYFRCCYFCSY